jgi:hypothetical protein
MPEITETVKPIDRDRHYAGGKAGLDVGASAGRARRIAGGDNERALRLRE